MAGFKGLCETDPKISVHNSMTAEVSLQVYLMCSAMMD